MSAPDASHRTLAAVVFSPLESKVVERFSTCLPVGSLTELQAGRRRGVFPFATLSWMAGGEHHEVEQVGEPRLETA